MKRSLRTADERKSPDFYYYEQKNSKKWKGSKETNSNMDANFRRPLSNLKFMLPSNHRTHPNTLKPIKKIVPKTANNTAILPKAATDENIQQIIPKPVSGTSVAGGAEFCKKAIGEPVLTDQNETSVILPTGQDLEHSIAKPVSDASIVGAAAVYEIDNHEPVLENQSETSTIISLTATVENLEEYIPKSVSGTSVVGGAELYEQSMGEPVLTDQNLTSQDLEHSIEKSVSGASIAGAALVYEIDIREPVLEHQCETSTILSDESHTHVTQKSVSDASAITTNHHQCCSYEFLLQILEKRDDCLLRKFETLIDNKLQATSFEGTSKERMGGREVDQVRGIVMVKNDSDTPKKSVSTSHPTRPGQNDRFPFKSARLAEEFNVALEDEAFCSDMVLEVVPFGQNSTKPTLKIFNSLFPKELQGHFNWEDKGTTIQSFPKILSLIHEAGKKIAEEKYDEQETNTMIKNSLRNARAKKK